jgi:hypothetical protein
LPVDGRVPIRPAIADPVKRRAVRSNARCEYMGLAPGMPITDIRSTRCSSAPAPTRASRTCAPRRRSCGAAQGRQRQAGDGRAGLRAGQAQAEAEGLDRVFREAGFEWREPGCSMCLAMNADKLEPGEHARIDLEPQFRGAPGAWRAHAPGESGDGGDRGLSTSRAISSTLMPRSRVLGCRHDTGRRRQGSQGEARRRRRRSDEGMAMRAFRRAPCAHRDRRAARSRQRRHRR